MFPPELHSKFSAVLARKLDAITDAFDTKDYEKAVILATKLSYWLKAVEDNHDDLHKLST
jgi:hypothetical protein